MIALQDESMQRHGFVSIIIGSNTNFIRVAGNAIQLARSAFIPHTALPLRVAALHFNFPEHHLHPLLRATLIACGRELRLRFRIHIEGTYST